MAIEVKCESGIIGWQDNLQNTYSNYAEWKAYAKMYGLHYKLGYFTPKAA